MKNRFTFWACALACVIGCGVGAAPAVASTPMETLFEEDMTASFEKLSVGMSLNEVKYLMKREPNKREISSHLGLEIQRLIWTQWLSASTYQVVIVAGRLVSKAAESKSGIVVGAV